MLARRDLLFHATVWEVLEQGPNKLKPSTVRRYLNIYIYIYICNFTYTYLYHCKRVSLRRLMTVGSISLHMRCHTLHAYSGP